MTRTHSRAIVVAMVTAAAVLGGCSVGESHDAHPAPSALRTTPTPSTSTAAATSTTAPEQHRPLVEPTQEPTTTATAPIEQTTTSLHVDSGPWPSGTPVPYRAVDLNGHSVTLASLKGSPILLIAWATWCVDCHQEMADLGRYLGTHSTGRVRVIAVEVDDPAGASGAKQVAESDGLSIPMWVDEPNAFSTAFSTLGVPTAAIVSSDGTLYRTFPGALELSNASIQAALNKVR